MNKLIAIAVFIGMLVVSIVRYCYNHYQFWTHVKTDDFIALTEYKGKNIKGLKGRQILIHKNFVPLIKQIDGYAEKNKVELIVNQSYRADNQSLSRAIVNPGEFSNHLAGFAIDFNIKSNGVKYFSNNLKRNRLNKLPNNIQNFIADIRKDKDLRWGGDFNKEDPVHIDSPVNLKSKERWQEYSRKCAADYANRVPKWKIWK